jgi:prephenate dehydratase
VSETIVVKAAACLQKRFAAMSGIDGDDAHHSESKNGDVGRTRRLKVAYLGPAASFSHQAALSTFPEAELVPHATFGDIFRSLQNAASTRPEAIGQSDGELGHRDFDFALLPIENSTNGSVVSALDLLAKCDERYRDVEVCGEYYLGVHHFLYTNHERSASPKFEAVKILYTHPQVWTQCSRYLAQHFGHAEKIDVSSTSAAATLVAKDAKNESAAICSELAGQVSKLHCLAEDIEDDPEGNTTRFFVLRNKQRQLNMEQVPGHDRLDGGSRSTEQVSGKTNVKALLLFTIAHKKPGSLSKALDVFAQHCLNLTRIDTRPSRQSSWHYVFFVECEERVAVGHVDRDGSCFDDERLNGAIKKLKQVTESVMCLGRWVDMLQFGTQN